jgi:hypothetical protein
VWACLLASLSRLQCQHLRSFRSVLVIPSALKTLQNIKVWFVCFSTYLILDRIFPSPSTKSVSTFIHLQLYLHLPTTIHWTAVKRILRYIKFTLRVGLTIGRSPSHSLSVFTDVDWANYSDDHKSTDHFAIFLSSNLISWFAKKQPTVSCSSTEAECKSMANATAKLMWVRSLLQELQASCPKMALLWCDTMGPKRLASNMVFHGRMKHIEVDYHFVHYQVVKHLSDVRFISTHDQLADGFTKAIPQQQLTDFRRNLNLTML